MKIEPNINYLAVFVTRMIAVFIVLLLMKICANGFLQDASWWWITLPLWFPTGLYLIWFILCWIFYCIATMEWTQELDPDDEKF